jgi:hypothetical protein
LIAPSVCCAASAAPITTLSVFLVAALVLFLSPGPNMAFVLSHGIAYGPRGGFAAALGIGAADLVLTALTAMGVTAIVAAWPPAFDILRYIGALYLVWASPYRARPCSSIPHWVHSAARSADFFMAARAPQNSRAGFWQLCWSRSRHALSCWTGRQRTEFRHRRCVFFALPQSGCRCIA